MFLFAVCLLRSRTKQLANVLGNLVVRHLVNRFHMGNLPRSFLLSMRFFELAFGFAWPENPDRVGIVEACDDFVVVLVEVAFGLASSLSSATKSLRV